jgi:hypothetical protein
MSCKYTGRVVYGVAMAKTNLSHLDSKAREILRSWTPQEMPSAQVSGGEIRPGSYRAFAAIGWVEHRNGVPTVGLQTFVLRHDNKHVGALTIGLPVTPRTELYVNALVQSFGWDGRVWPYDNDKGWPEGTDDEAQVLGLLARVNLASSMTFPSVGDKGVPAVRIEIPKSHGPFPLPPSTEVDSPPVHLARLRALIADPSIFQPTSTADSLRR